MPHHIPHHRAPEPPPTRGGGAGLLLALAISAAGLSLYFGGHWLHRRLFEPPEDTKTVESPINDREWQEMQAALLEASGAYSGNVGIYMKDLHTGRVWEYRADRSFPSASLIKVPIMASVLEKVKEGSLTLDTEIKLTRRGRVGGSGSLKWVRDGTSLSVREIIYKMITESDNTATRMLINYVGMDYLAEKFSRLGLSVTNITQEGMSLSSYRVARENYTTAREMGGLMEKIYNGELVDREASEFMMEVLKHNKSRSRLRRGLPLGWEIGHKTGLLRMACHDVGIVFSPRGDYVLAVLTSEVPDYRSAKNFISKVARLTYRYYKIDAAYAQSRAKNEGAPRSL